MNTSFNASNPNSAPTPVRVPGPESERRDHTGLPPANHSHGSNQWEAYDGAPFEFNPYTPYVNTVSQPQPQYPQFQPPPGLSMSQSAPIPPPKETHSRQNSSMSSPMVSSYSVNAAGISVLPTAPRSTSIPRNSGIGMNALATPYRDYPDPSPEAGYGYGREYNQNRPGEMAMAMTPTPGHATPDTLLGMGTGLGSPSRPGSSKPESGKGSYEDGQPFVTLPPSGSSGSGTKLRRGGRGMFGSKRSASGGAEYMGVGHDAVRSRKKKTRIIFFVVALIAIVILAVILPVYFLVIRPHSSNPSTTGGSTNNGGGNDPSSAIDFSPLGGENGSTIFDPLTNTSFVYVNPFGGRWFFDPSNPMNSDPSLSSSSSPSSSKATLKKKRATAQPAQAQSFTPPLTTPFPYGTVPIRGVNLGGWLVLEPFITPALFQKYSAQGAQDEYTLSQAMRADTSPGGGISQLEKHYSTFITEEDFAQIAAAGLNWVRIPVPYWAVGTFVEDPEALMPNSSSSSIGNLPEHLSPQTPLNEPFLPRSSFVHLLNGLGWARKYGLRVLLEIHTAPGSQNSNNHSGRGGGGIGWLNGVMGLANGQRLEAILGDFVDYFWGGGESGWSDVVGIFGLVNEPRVAVIGKEPITNFNLHMHDRIRNVTGIGEGKGPYIAIHDGFVGISSWTGYLPGSDRIALDTHPYFAFSGAPLTTPQTPLDSFPPLACKAFGPNFVNSQKRFGLTLAGEFSGAMNDCGLFLLGPPVAQSDTAYEKNGGNCNDWMDWESWDSARVGVVKDFVEASMDALSSGGGWFFWTWKIAPDMDGKIRSPVWSYQLGMQQGWVPKDPREVQGKCVGLGVQPPATFDGTYSAWQTGGAGAGNIDPSTRAAFDHWPPTTINNLTPGGAQATLLPRYTNTGSGSALPRPTITAVLPMKNGKSGEMTTVTITPSWKNTNVGASAQPTEVGGCHYPNAWDGNGVPVPSAAC